MVARSRHKNLRRFLFKFMNLFSVNGINCFLRNKTRTQEHEMQGRLRALKIQKRKRKTTLERVVSMEAYSQKYVVNWTTIPASVVSYLRGEFFF